MNIHLYMYIVYEYIYTYIFIIVEYPYLGSRWIWWAVRLLRIFSATDPQGWLAGTLLADGTVAVDADSGSFLVIFLYTV